MPTSLNRGTAAADHHTPTIGNVHSEPPSAGIDRAALILDAFDGPGRLTLAQVVRRTGLPRSSAHRILGRLVTLRWLHREGDGYQLGMRLLELGSLAIHQDRLHQAAQPYLHELHRRTGYVVHLAVLKTPDVLYLDKVGSRPGLPSRIGGLQPAHRTSVGKVLLAYLPTIEQTRFLAHADLRAYTTNTMTNPARLRDEFARIRNRGMAVDRQESLPGITCVGVPVGTPEHTLAALSVCGPTAGMRPEHTLATPLRITARAISRAYEAASGTPGAVHTPRLALA